jgi:hypothetical protein
MPGSGNAALTQALSVMTGDPCEVELALHGKTDRQIVTETLGVMGKPMSLGAVSRDPGSWGAVTTRVRDGRAGTH